MVSEWCAASPMGRLLRFHDESGHARQRSQRPHSRLLEYLVRGRTLMTLSGFSPEMSVSVHRSHSPGKWASRAVASIHKYRNAG